MRFAKVTLSHPQPPRQAAFDFIRKLVAPAKPLPTLEETAKAIADLPLDQRVRLVGEW